MEHQDFVLVPKDEFEAMADDLRFLHYLEKAGVDLWEGYERALEMYSADDFDPSDMYQPDMLVVDDEGIKQVPTEDVMFDEDEYAGYKTEDDEFEMEDE